MIRSIYTAATGMKANQLYIDNISNNLSNVNTMGFKKSRVEFEDLMYQTIQAPGGESEQGVQKPTGLQIGLGTKATSNSKIFVQGNIINTGSPTDIAIQGDGFFQIQMPDGTTNYTRNGHFNKSAEGYLTTDQGFIIEPPIVIPEGTSDFGIDATGSVSVVFNGDSESTVIGQLELARFINPGGMKALGGNLYQPTLASGTPFVGAPGMNSTGKLLPQSLEASNVQMVEEMVNMIIAQRAYEVSSKAITTSDDMLNTANQLKR